MVPVFETKYSTVSSVSNNAVQQFSGNLTTRSGGCLRTHCCATAQAAVEFSKDHWLFLHLVLFSAQKDKPVFRFLCVSLVHLSFMKRSVRSFFRQENSSSHWIKAPRFVTASVTPVREGSAQCSPAPWIWGNGCWHRNWKAETKNKRFRAAYAEPSQVVTNCSRNNSDHTFRRRLLTMRVVEH